MRHDWVFDVLRDLKAYAQTNGLPALALKAEEALRIARAEISAEHGTEAGTDADANASALANLPPIRGRAH